MNKRTAFVVVTVIFSWIVGLLVGAVAGMKYQKYRADRDDPELMIIGQSISVAAVPLAVNKGPLDGTTPVAIYSVTNGSSQRLWLLNLALTVSPAICGDGTIWTKINGVEQPHLPLAKAGTYKPFSVMRLKPHEMATVEVFINNPAPNGKPGTVVAAPISLTVMEYYGDNGQTGVVAPMLDGTEWRIE